MLSRIYKAVSAAIWFVINCVITLLLPLLALVCAILRFVPKRFDIGIGPVPIINGYHWSKALKKRGYAVETFAFGGNYITSEFDFICDEKQHRLFSLFPVLLFLRSAARYRCVIVYFSGGPLQFMRNPLWRLEPQLYHLARVKTIVVPYGSDTQVLERTPNKLFADCLCRDYPGLRYRHDRVRRQIDVWTKNADIVVGAMDSVDYLYFWNRSRPCHFAFDTEKIKPSYFKDEGKTIKILHAPNHQAVKGTPSVVKAVDELFAQGYDIELMIIQRVPNDELLRRMADADIVVDQLIIGWYAMFALEAMASGKPVVCYIRPDLKEFYENAGGFEKDEMPIISATPLSLKDTLRELIENKDRLAEIGRRSREFVERHHSYDVVGKWFEDILVSIGVNASNKACEQANSTESI